METFCNRAVIYQGYLTLHCHLPKFIYRDAMKHIHALKTLLMDVDIQAQVSLPTVGNICGSLEG